MKIIRDEVLTKNLDFFSTFAVNIQPGDTAEILETRVGSKLLITPDDGSESEQYSVVFTTNMVLAVSKGSNAENLLSLINAALAALGGAGDVGSLGGGSGVPQAITSLGKASLETIQGIVRTVANQGVIIPKVDVHEQSTTPRKIKVVGRVAGWTVTTDNELEVSKTDFFVSLVNAQGNHVITNNDSLQAPLAIPANQGETSETAKSITGTGLAQLQIDWNLSTDGAWTYDTVSLIQIKQIQMDFIYT